MARVAIEMVKKTGVDLDKLLTLLVKNASAELTTYYYYTILRANLIGLKGEAVTDLTPYGKVKVGDTFWRAKAKGGYISKGEIVETVNVDEKKLILKVLKTESE